MKLKQKVIAGLLLFWALTGVVHGQQLQRRGNTPEWVPTTGYWVVVSNVKTPLSSVVYFYTNDNIEFYSEKIDSIELDIKNPKICRKLNQILDHSLQVWAQLKSIQSQELVKVAFKPRKRW